MERLKFGRDLMSVFRKWNRGRADTANISDLNEAINFATNNGIDLLVKVPKKIFNKTSGMQAMSRDDAIDFSIVLGGDYFIFEIPSENKKRDAVGKDLRLSVVEEYRGLGSCVLLKDKYIGVFGTFLPGEIASIEPK
jgi:hypothetical protein